VFALILQEGHAVCLPPLFSGEPPGAAVRQQIKKQKNTPPTV
jgi:hypothetical protein